MMSVLPYECENARGQLPEYAGGALVGRELARVEQHLASCERCQKEVADLRTVIGAVRAVSPEPMPDTLLPRLRLALQERVPAPGARLLWPRLAVPLAILTGVVAVSFALRAPKRTGGLARGAEVAMAPGRPQATLAPQLAGKAGEGARRAGGGAGGLSAGAIAPEAEEAPSLLSPADRHEVAQAPGAPFAGQPMQLAEKAEEPARSAAKFAQPPATADQEMLGLKPAPTREMKAPQAGRKPAERPRLAREGGARGMGGTAGGAGVPGPSDRPGLHSKRIRWGPQGARERDEGPSAAAGSMAKAEAATAPPLFARASLVAGADGSIIALEVASEAHSDSITVRVGSGPPQTFQWRGAGARPATVPLPMDRLGPGPAAVPVEVTSSAGRREYVLFVPTMARLGQVAPTAPVAKYESAPLGSVLADLSAMTGLVILAEQPLNAEIKGAIPKGTPEASLRQLGMASGFDVQAQGDLVFTLTRRR